ncbi:MAG: hypothetical protein P4L64_09190 [Caulobacteraceae bacterium]|nr:hypothetical protein [Caulobacteraceae bacterium]
MSLAGGLICLALGGAATPAVPSAPAPETPIATAPRQPPPPVAEPAPDPSHQADPTTGEGPPAEPLADGDRSTVTAAYQAAEQRQGPMDGHWRLSDNDGAPLFDFMLTDTGGLRSARFSRPDHPDIEGAWRDLRREGSRDDAGVLDSVRQDGDTLIITFSEHHPDQALRLVVKRAANGEWTGALDEGGTERPVFMNRL